jgi:hypothetical protein
LVLAVVTNFVLQWPGARVADWALSWFYDPGAVLKADALLEKGYVPTEDFGYTHGLLPLVLARVAFRLLGRAPWTYLALTLALEVVMAWGLARVLHATRAGWRTVALLMCLVPVAVMPAYLTLTHVLEATLMLLALADVAERKYPRALAILAACAFVKPSMAYVAGALLVTWITLRERGALGRSLLSAAGAWVGLGAVLVAWFGLAPVVRTMVPLTGSRAYASTGFGLLSSGRAFWLRESVGDYLFTPAGAWLVCVMVTTWAAFRVAWRMRPRDWGTRETVLVGVAVMHGAFLLAFYGWTGSWTHYAYMPVLGVVLATGGWLERWHRGRGAVVALGALAMCGNLEVARQLADDWRYKVPAPGGLWAYREQWEEWERALEPLRGKRGVVMSHGFPADLPDGVERLDTWFPEPGIPTPTEMNRALAQVEAAGAVVLWNEYVHLSPWSTPVFQHLHARARVVYQGTYLTTLALDRAP